MNGIEVPLELCRECGQCCRFVSPRHLSPYAARGSERLPSAFLSRSGSPVLAPDSKDGVPVWTCSLFDGPSGRCQDHPDHPLDCRIYPLVLFFDDRPRIGLDLSCPYTSMKPADWFLKKAEELASSFWSTLSGEDLLRLIPLLKEDAGKAIDPLVDLTQDP